MKKEKVSKKTCAKVWYQRLCGTRIKGDSGLPPCGFNEYGSNTNDDSSNSNYNDNNNNDNSNSNSDNKHA